jgi:hypothetical protein
MRLSLKPESLLMSRNSKMWQVRRILFVPLAVTISASAKNVFVHPTFYPAGRFSATAMALSNRNSLFRTRVSCVTGVWRFQISIRMAGPT